MSDSGMTDNENQGSRSRLGRRRPHALPFGVNAIGRTLFIVLIALGPAEGFSPGSKALSGRALGAVFPVSQPYGAVNKEVNATPDGVHAGIDFLAPPGTGVHAVRDGTVIKAGGPSGTVAVFDGENTVLYIHMQDIDVSKLNERITVGAFLGTVGRVGATGVHLHVEVRKGRHEVGVGCTVDEYVKMRKWPKGYCDSPRRVADLTLDPMGYLVGAQQAVGAGGGPEEQEKSQKAPERPAGGTSELSVKWSLGGGAGCASSEFVEWAAQVHGQVAPSIDLGDDQIARQLLQEGRRVYLRSCPPLRKLKAVLVVLFTATYGEGKAMAVQAYVSENQFRDYQNFPAQNARRNRLIQSFIQRFKVEAWLDSSEMRGRFAANPFLWKGKVVGFVAEFGAMLTVDSGVFDFGLLSLIVVKRLPSARFTRSGEKFLLAGRVQGVSQVQLPLLGSTPVPELSFIGAEAAPR